MIAQLELTQSNLKLSQLGLGCASMAGIFSPVDTLTALNTIKVSYDRGIRYFDTAPFYGHGRSERMLGDILRKKTGYVLSTKVGRILKPGLKDGGAWVQALPFTPFFDYSYDGIMRSIEDSLQRLGLDSIDIAYVHDIGELTHGYSKECLHWSDLTKNINGKKSGYKALRELRESGVLKAIGLGVNETKVCLNALEFGSWDIFLLAGRYSLLEQSPLDKLFPECEKLGTDIVIGGPFNSGVLVGGDTFDYGVIPDDVYKRIKKIKEICNSHSVSLPAAALRFVSMHPIVKSVIPGPRTPTELSEILKWWQEDIPNSLWSDLKSDKLLHPNSPIK